MRHLTAELASTLGIPVFDILEALQGFGYQQPAPALLRIMLHAAVDEMWHGDAERIESLQCIAFA